MNSDNELESLRARVEELEKRNKELEADAELVNVFMEDIVNLADLKAENERMRAVILKVGEMTSSIYKIKELEEENKKLKEHGRLLLDGFKRLKSQK